MMWMGCIMDIILFVKNGLCMVVLGVGGEGYILFLIVGFIGEGVIILLMFICECCCLMIDDFWIFGWFIVNC